MALRIVTANPSTIELEPSSLPREWVLEGDPQVRATEIARSGDASTTVIVWSCTEGKFRWEYSVDETVQILSGRVIITDHDGRRHCLAPGDSAFFPAGTSSVWHVTQAMRKVAVCHTGVPRVVSLGLRAWNWGTRRAHMLFAGGATATSSHGHGLGPKPRNKHSLV